MAIGHYAHWKRNISVFLASQTISLFGSSIVQYAIMWYITLTTQSGVMMTIGILCGFVPTFLLSSFAGVWADRYNRKMLIMLSDSAIAFATLILAIFFLNGYKSFWLLFLMFIIRSIGTGIQTPAVGAILPQIVPEEQLTKVNGINGSIQAFVMLVSPMISAALLGITTLEMMFFIDVVTAAVAVAALLFFLRIPAHKKASEQQKAGYFDDFKEGLSYIKHHHFLKTLFAFFAIFFILAAPVSFLTPLQVTRTFGGDVWKLSAIEMTFSIGMMIGGAVIALWGGFTNRTYTMALSGMLFAVCTLLLGIVPNFWIYCGIMVLAGVTMPLFNTPTTVLLQEKVEGDFLGRIFGVFNMISTSMMPLGMLIFGPISDFIKIELLLIGTGIVMLMLSFMLAANKVLIEAGKPIRKT
ncbi:MFS transporter [Ureibacillus terrenus]|uniref:MFS transporter n=1 Tax=Ureibacillus terrenus TaxID=118246 RepID=A0A540V0W1_9BACL|nr:MFS transporter [Ureibacillus terrenus]TQE90366.1 MFS transporter [Ureibacillus terrenus]